VVSVIEVYAVDVRTLNLEVQLALTVVYEHFTAERKHIISMIDLNNTKIITYQLTVHK
jgi:hypothetical protein